MSGARARLYVIPGSHACRAAILMLENKRIPYRLVTLPTGAHSTIVLVLPRDGEPVWIVRKTELSNVRALASAMWAKDGRGVADGEDFVEALARRSTG